MRIPILLEKNRCWCITSVRMSITCSMGKLEMIEPKGFTTLAQSDIVRNLRLHSEDLRTVIEFMRRDWRYGMRRHLAGKPKNSTMLPDEWSRAKVLNEVKSTYQDALSGRNGARIWQSGPNQASEGVSPGGVSIRGYITPSGMLDTAHPIN